MKSYLRKFSRQFQVGSKGTIQLRDCGSIQLEPDEQITFQTDEKFEYDVLRKSWGYYATPSLNARLLRFQLHAALICNHKGHYFVVLVEDAKRDEFADYLAKDSLRLVTWLDSNQQLSQVDQHFNETHDIKTR